MSRGVRTSTAQQEQASALYDRLAPVYGPMAGWWERRAREAGLAVFAARPGEHVLEIGCGPGAALVSLARSVGPEGQVAGIDVSPAMCQVARQRVDRSVPGSPVDVVEADAGALPFEPGGFDGCFMSFVLELFEPVDRRAVLGECRRVLRSDGRLTVVGLSDRGPDTAMRRLYRRGHRRFPRVLDCRPIDVASALSASGFVVTSSHVLRKWGLPVEVVTGRPG